MQNEEKVMAAINLALGKKPDQFKPVKDFLYQVRDAERRIHRVEDRIEFREESIGAHGSSYSECIPGNTDYAHSSVENAVMAIDALNRELRAAENAYADVKVTVSEFIAILPDVNQQTVITKKYIRGQDWGKITTDMNMSVRSVQRLHGRTLPLLQEALKLKKAS